VPRCCRYHIFLPCFAWGYLVFWVHIILITDFVRKLFFIYVILVFDHCSGCLVLSNVCCFEYYNIITRLYIGKIYFVISNNTTVTVNTNDDNIILYALCFSPRRCDISFDCKYCNCKRHVIICQKPANSSTLTNIEFQAFCATWLRYSLFGPYILLHKWWAHDLTWL